MAKIWRTLTTSWQDASDRLGSAGRLLADNLDNLNAIVKSPDLLGPMSSITGLHDHMLIAQTQQIHALAVLITGIVNDNMPSLLSDLERLIDRHRHSLPICSALQSLFSLYSQEHVRLSLILQELQRAIRINKNWTRASAWATKLHSSLNESRELKQLLVELSDLNS